MTTCPKCNGRGEYFWDDHCQGMWLECDRCKGTGEVKPDNLPTKKQIEYAADLLDKLGYDKAEYGIENMSRAELSELISELKDEWEG